jgi:hypothetical protein
MRLWRGRGTCSKGLRLRRKSAEGEEHKKMGEMAAVEKVIRVLDRSLFYSGGNNGEHVTVHRIVPRFSGQ